MHTHMHTHTLSDLHSPFRFPLGKTTVVVFLLGNKVISLRTVEPMAKGNEGSGKGSWKKQVDDIKRIFELKEILGT